MESRVFCLLQSSKHFLFHFRSKMCRLFEPLATLPVPLPDPLSATHVDSTPDIFFGNAERDNLLGQISSHQIHIDTLLEQIDLHSGERKRLESLLCQLQLCTADREEKICTQQLEIEELRAKINLHAITDQQMAALQKKIDAHVGEREHLQNCVRQQQLSILDSEQKVNEQHVEIGELRVRIDQQQQQLAEKDQKIDELKQECSRFCKDLKVAKDDRFEKSENFFREEFDHTLNRRDACMHISDVINNRFADSTDPSSNVLQLKAIFDRITAIDTLQRPYEDLLDDTVKLFFPKRLFEKKDENDKTPPVLKVDLDSVLSVIGTNYFFNKHMDLYTDFLNSQLPSSKAFMLKPTEYNTLLLNGPEEEISKIRAKVKGRNKILVPYRMEKLHVAHWFLYSINIEDSPPTIVCYDTIRRAKFNIFPNNGDDYFADMETIASRLFPNKFPSTLSAGN